jgi:hypothetical protein
MFQSSTCSPAVLIKQLHSGRFQSASHGGRISKCHGGPAVDGLCTVYRGVTDAGLTHKIRCGPTKQRSGCSNLRPQNAFCGITRFRRPLDNSFYHMMIF